MTKSKMLKKLKKFIKKEWKIKVTPDPDEKIIKLAEKIAIHSENCTVEEAYKKWIFREDLHLPGWISMYIIDEFVDNGITANNTVGEMIDEVL